METIENFVEVYVLFIDHQGLYRLIYERIGTYLRKSLIKLYEDEEKRFN